MKKLCVREKNFNLNFFNPEAFGTGSVQFNGKPCEITQQQMFIKIWQPAVFQANRTIFLRNPIELNQCGAFCRPKN